MEVGMASSELVIDMALDQIIDTLRQAAQVTGWGLKRVCDELSLEARRLPNGEIWRLKIRPEQVDMESLQSEIVWLREMVDKATLTDQELLAWAIEHHPDLGADIQALQRRLDEIDRLLAEV